MVSANVVTSSITTRGGGGPLTATKPAGTVASDLLVAFHTMDTTLLGTINPPVGWNVLGKAASAVQGGTIAYWAPGDVASTTFETSSSADNVLILLRVANASGAYLAGAVNTTTRLVAPGVNPLSPSGLLISALGMTSSVSLGSVGTPPASMTLVQKGLSNSFAVLEVATEPWASSANTGVRTFGGDGTGSNTAAISVVVPDAGSVATSVPVPSFSIASDGEGVFTVTPVNTTFESVNGEATTWLWDMGDGTTYNTKTVTHTYANAPVKTVRTVTLTASNSAGSAQAQNTVTCYPTPSTDYAAADFLTVTTSPGGAFTASKPKFTKDTDLLLAVFGVDGSGGSTQTAPAGWTLLIDDTSAFGFKAWTAPGNVASTTFGASTGSDCVLVMARITGSTGVPIVSVARLPAPEPTLVSNKGGVLVAATHRSGVVALTAPSGMSNLASASSRTYVTVGGASQRSNNTGVLGPKAFAPSGNGDNFLFLFPDAGTFPPVASFTSVGNRSGQSTSFTDTSINSPTSWLWDFGDGQTSTLANPTHVYATPGTYTVTLTVSNTAGSNQVSSSLSVIAPPPYKASQFMAFF